MFTRFYNRYSLLLVIIGGSDLLFFAWSINYLDIASASIVAELWIVLFVLLRYYTKNKREKDNNSETTNDLKLSNSIWILLIFALLGVIYVTLSHNSINPSFNIFGLILIIVYTVLCVIKIERSIYWAEEMENQWKKRRESENNSTSAEKNKRVKNKRVLKLLLKLLSFILVIVKRVVLISQRMVKEEQTRIKAEEDREQDDRRKLVFVAISVIAAHSATIILVIVGRVALIFQGFSWNLTFAPSQTGSLADMAEWLRWLICIAGGLAYGIVILSFRKSNVITYTLDVNGIYYLTPVLSVLWLMPFELIQLEQWDYFIIGALIIVATSIIIGIETETHRKGFRWLIISLWSTGVLIYFREEWIQLSWLADGTTWEWVVETVDYYSLIVLSATIFILILSFRLSRLVERTNKEEDQYLRMKHIIKYLYLDPSPKESLNFHLDKLDQFNAKTGSEARENFVGDIESLREEIGPPSPIDRTEANEISDSKLEYIKNLSDLELEFKLLYQSKQRGRYLAENLVLYIFALVTIMVTIGTRPAVISPWNALLIDILAFLFSSAICFMTINLVDLRLYRERPTDEENDSRNQTAVQVISIILAIVMSLSFVVLLYDKWMGVWFI